MPCSNPRCRRMKLATSCVLCALALTPSVRAQASAPTSPADLSTYVAEAMKAFSVPGLALAIVKDGKIIVAKGYGVRKLGDATAVDEHTMFGIGSNTKAFTTAAPQSKE
jgi:CubicO group peptidase (beta-lactamase class C family)